MEITRIRGATGDQVLDRVEKAIKAGGFRLANASAGPTWARMTFELETTLVGHNIHIGFRGSERRINKLGWDDFVWVNNTINDVLDEMKVSANAQSLKGKFVIRRGHTRFTEQDWEENKWMNVGSIMEPVMLAEQHRPAPERVLPEEFQRGVRVRPHKRRRA